MSKPVAFGMLAILAVGFAIFGSQYQANFLADAWSQLFWICVSTVATTFVLESILQRGERIRAQRRDRFAVRTFSADLMISLQEIVGIVKPDKLTEAALAGNREFNASAEATASLVAAS